MSSKLVLTLTHLPTQPEILNEIAVADLVEIRLDYFTVNEFYILLSSLLSWNKPTIISCRREKDGGKFINNESLQLQHIRQFLSLYSPNYLDLEYDISTTILHEFHTQYPHTQLIRSFHYFISTPDENILESLLKDMLVTFIHHYKVITFAQSSLDNLTILRFLQKHASKISLCAHAMGENGMPSRVLGKIFHSKFVFASTTRDTPAPGMLNIQELLTIYHWHDLNALTHIYGLIGDPIDQSLGHIFHNQLYAAEKQNAIYVKFLVKNHELADFLKRASDIPILGLSITMPHKQAVSALIHSSPKQNSPYNTLCYIDSHWEGYNTDGQGAIAAIGDQIAIHDAKVLILGAGGAAIALAIALENAGAKLTIANRTLKHAHALSAFLKEIHRMLTLDELSKLASDQHYDLIINTLPHYAYKNWQCPAQLLQNQPTIMDINYNPRETDIIKIAQLYNCPRINGWDMYVHQALEQYAIWFKKRPEIRSFFHDSPKA